MALAVDDVAGSAGSPVRINVSVDVSRAVKGLDFATKQVPFATARALTALARTVQQAETTALPQVFDRPTPFTMRAFGITAASKTTLTAEVFAKARQAAYLQPSEVQGPQFLGAGKRIRTPIGIGLNTYGNIPRRKIAQLIARKKAFLGVIKGVNGLWLRLPKGKLQLLVDFTEPVDVKSHLGFQDRAAKVIAANFDKTFHAALRDALATAR